MGQAGCERTVKFLLKIQKKIFGGVGLGRGAGVIVDVNEELKSL